MQYLISVIDGSGPAPGGSAIEDEETALDAFNERLEADGHWVFAGGLGAPDSATVIDNRDGTGVVTDRPYAESKEYLGGFWIIEAPDLDVALKLCLRGVEGLQPKGRGAAHPVSRPTTNRPGARHTEDMIRLGTPAVSFGTKMPVVDQFEC